MDNYLADEDITLRIPLRVNGEPVVPDAGSVTFTVRDNTGQVVVDKEPVVMATASSEATVTILAAHNALTGRFGQRVVVVNFAKSGRPLSMRESYRLTAWLNTSVVEDDVRNFIGVDRGELPDSAVDIADAYLDVEQAVGAAPLEAALASGDRLQTLANRMILARSVLNVLPGLPMRLSQSESNGVFSATRAKIDFDKLADAAEAMYAEGLAELVFELDVNQDLLIAPALAPDPITGG